MNDVMVCFGVIAGQVHGPPVLMSLFGFKVEPGKVGSFTLEAKLLFGNSGVVFGYFGTKVPGTGVGEDGKIFSGIEA